MRSSLSSDLPDPLPGAALLRTLAGAALSASAIAAAALAVALSAPAPAHGETVIPGITAQQQAFSLPAPAAPRFGPGLGTTDLLPAGPAPVTRAAAPQFRLEADDGAVSTTDRTASYDLRQEYGTVFDRTAVMRGRLVSRVVTRF